MESSNSANAPLRTSEEYTAVSSNAIPVKERSKSEHISKELKTQQQIASAVKLVGVVAVTLVFSSITASLVAIAAAHHAMTAYKSREGSNSLLAKKKTMVSDVKNSRMKTMNKISTETLKVRGEAHQAREVANVLQIDYATLQLNMPQLEEISKKRLLLNALVRNGVQLTPELKSKSSEELLKMVPENLRDNVEGEMWKNIPKKVTEEQVEKFNHDLAVLTEQLTALPTDSISYTKTIQQLRELLTSDVYQLTKQDSSQPTTQFLHRLCAGLWNDVNSMDAFKKFGDAVVEKSSKDLDLEREERLSSSENPIGEGTVDTLKKSVQKVKSEFQTDHGLPARLLYAITNPKQALGAMASEGGIVRKVADIFGKGTYDPHLLGNIASLQGHTKVEIGGDTATINNVYGGSPTIGDDEIDFIYLAVIQGAENNQLGPPEHRLNDIPDKVFYTNFQDLGKKGGEGPRSVTIMSLNDRFPIAFMGITLSKDSSFYMMRDEQTWIDAENFGKEMMEKLTEENSFSLEGRVREKGKEDAGFYFPGSEQDWFPLFHNVITAANTQFEGKTANTPEEAKALRGAYQEFVYNSLQFQLDMKLVAQLKAEGLDKPKVQSQRLCKENIDRGGVGNAVHLYLRLPTPDLEDKAAQREREGLIAGCLHCRALLARGLMILEGRLPQSFALMENVSPQDFMDKQMEILKKDGIAVDSTPVYTPALSTPSNG